METNKRKVLILFFSTLVVICEGTIYAFSIFARPLAKVHGWTLSEVMMAFTICIAISPIPMIVGGELSDKGKARELTLLSMILLAAAFYLSGLATQKWQLYLTYGVIGGLGLNLGYIACLNNTPKFFGKRRGLATGIITSGIAIGTVITAPVSELLINKVGVIDTLKLFGLFFLITGFVANFFIKNASAEESNHTETTQTKQQYSWNEMIKSPLFYCIVIMFLAEGFTEMVVSSNSVEIGTSMFHVSTMIAATFVSLYSIASMLGGMVWGAVSDKLSYFGTFLAVYLILIFSLVCLIFLDNIFGYSLGMIGVGSSAGGFGALVPIITTKIFGEKNEGVNFGIIFTGFSLAALFAPSYAAKIAESSTDQYIPVFKLCITFVLIGIIFLITLQKLSQKRKNKI